MVKSCIIRVDIETKAELDKLRKNMSYNSMIKWLLADQKRFVEISSVIHDLYYKCK